MTPAAPSTSRMLPRFLALLLPLLGGADPEAAARTRTARVTIKNVKQNEYLYAYSKKRRGGHLALTWIPGFDATKDESGQWDMTIRPLGRYRAQVTIKNVRYPSFLYVGEHKRDRDRRYAYTGDFDPYRMPGNAVWEMHSIRPGVATLRNAMYREFLYAGVPRWGSSRRYALTWVPGFDASRDATGQWLINKLFVFPRGSGSLEAGSARNHSEGLDFAELLAEDPITANITEGLDPADFMTGTSDGGVGVAGNHTEMDLILP